MIRSPRPDRRTSQVVRRPGQPNLILQQLQFSFFYYFSIKTQKSDKNLFLSKIAVIAEGPKTLWNLEKKWWCDFFSVKAFIRVRQSPAEREKKCEDDADGGSAAKNEANSTKWYWWINLNFIYLGIPRAFVNKLNRTKKYSKYFAL